MYGCSLPGASDSNDFMFAPKDIAPWKQLTFKDNTQGIGYKGMMDAEVLSSSTFTKDLYGMSGQVKIFIYLFVFVYYCYCYINQLFLYFISFVL